MLFVGLDGADWQYLDPLIARGAMPNLARLVAEGRRGILTTESPPLSPLLWTTMMTGQGPRAHGILDFTRFHPVTGVREPITSDERRVPAIWNMAGEQGRSVAVLGLWATHPAEAVRGLMVSDRLFSFQRRETPPPGVVSPAGEEAWARAVLAETVASVGVAELRAYLPWLSVEEGQRLADPPDPFAHPVSALRRILIETRVVHRLASEWWRRSATDLEIVYHQGSDAIGHVLAPYAPPRQPGISEADFERYGAVPERYFRELDDLLGQYRQMAQERGAVLMLASDHGFLWGEGRPRELASQAQATAGKWHRDQGVYLLWNAGLPAGAGPAGGIRQVCATLLALAGLPPGQGLAGPALGGVEAVGAARDYAAGFRPARRSEAAEGQTVASAEEVAKLRALGYLGAGEPARAPAGAGNTRTAGSHNNEGLILESEGNGTGAIAAFELALALDPGLAAAAWNLSRLAAGAGDWRRADAMLVRAFRSGLPEGEQQVAARVLVHRESDRVEAARRLLEAAIAARPEAGLPRLLRGRLRMEASDCAGAETDFLVVTRTRSDDAVAFASLGLARLCLGDRTGGRKALERSLELDPDQPAVRAALSQ